MDFCTPNEYLEFMRQAPDLERMLGPFGHPAVQVLVFCHEGGTATSLHRTQDRSPEAMETVPYRPWHHCRQWDDYTEAKEAMFFYTDTADAPWVIVKSSDKKRARLNCMHAFPVITALP